MKAAKRNMRNRKVSGFTLIELLIVVAIIAILAAIAVPNFLEAQVRSKVSRVKTDLRTVSVALETYRVDHNAYPILCGYVATGFDSYWHGGIHMCWDLTTPLAYMATVQLVDPFSPFGTDKDGWLDGMRPFSYSYVNINLSRTKGQNLPKIADPQWVLLSLGPDYAKGPDPTGSRSEWQIQYYSFDPMSSGPTPGDRRFKIWEYDATNGTKSGGDVLRWP